MTGVGVVFRYSCAAPKWQIKRNECRFKSTFSEAFSDTYSYLVSSKVPVIFHDLCNNLKLKVLYVQYDLGYFG